MKIDNNELMARIGVVIAIIVFGGAMLYNVYHEVKMPLSEHWFIERRFGLDVECSSEKEARRLAGGHRIYKKIY